MSPQRRNVIVGVVVLGGLGLLVWMLLTFAGGAASIFTKSGLTVALTAERADGLSPGSIVYYRGVEVGRVMYVRLLPDNVHVEIGLDVFSNPPLPRNLVGLIRTNSALGSAAAVTLEPQGPPDKTPLQSGAQLVATYVGLELFPPEITQLAGQFRQQQLVLHLDQTVMSIREQAEKVGAVLDSVQKIVSDPKIQEQVHEAIANIHNASESVSRIGAKFEKLTDKVDTVVDNANGTMTDLRATVVHANGHVDDLSRQIGDDTEKLGKVLDQFQTAAATLNQGKGTAGLLVNDPKLYNSLVDTVKTLNATVLDLKRVIDQWEQEGVSLKMGK